MSRLGRTNFGYSVMGKLEKKRKKIFFFFLVSLFFFFAFRVLKKQVQVPLFPKLFALHQPRTRREEEEEGLSNIPKTPPPQKKDPVIYKVELCWWLARKINFFFVGVSSGSPRRISVCPLRVYLSIYTRERAISVWFFFLLFSPPLWCVSV